MPIGDAVWRWASYTAGMFGLGPWEMLLIAGVIALLGGPKLVKQLFGYARSAQKLRSELTPQAMLRRVIDEDSESDKRAASSKRKRSDAEQTVE